MRSALRVLVLALAAAATASAQRQTIDNAIRPFVKVDAPLVALTHARVIDGTGAPARDDQTLVLRDGVIASIAPSAGAPPPEGAVVIDLTGRTVMPGLV